jgi:hypothetical protein
LGVVWRGRTDVGVKKCERVYGRAEGGLPLSPDVVQPLMTAERALAVARRLS